MYSTNNMGFFTYQKSIVLSVFIGMLSPLIFGNVQAQITVDQASTNNEVEQLVEDVLLGSCVTVSNVNYTGPASAAGTFDASGTTFTMQSGILLTTGSANTAIGPDDDNNAGVNQNTSGDADLTALATENTYDAVVLEFDFVPEDDTLTFRYVFASEEYPEWVGSEYNDVFGFFMSGPGVSGPYTGGAANIALIPGTTTPVAINNVNNGYSNSEPASGPCTNCAYYVENGSGPDVQYDGYTTVLTAQAIVTPCETYHIRLAIADAGDHIYDSGVFLEAGSFTSGGGITVDFTNVGIEEGCSDEYIVFSRVDQSNNSMPISATYSIGGTATSGVDYNAFPLSVTIPAGQNSVTVPISVPLDFTIEGTETIIVYMDQPPCDCLAPGSATINVIDNDVPLALTTSGETTICLGQSANLTASVSGSLPPYSGSWDNGAPVGENVSVSPTTTTTYTYTVTDACNSQTQTSSETITVIRPDFNANDESQCLDGNSFNFTNTGATGGSVTHYWTFGDGNSSTAENPTHSYLADGDFTVTHYVIYTASNCTASASALITVYPEPTVSVSVDADVICSGGTDGALSASVSGGTPGYNYLWSPGLATGSSISGVGVGTYTVTVTDANGCTDSDAGTVVQNDPTPPTIICPATANISMDAGLCTSSASIGTPTTDDNCGVASVVVDNPGPYSVGTTTVTWTVTDDNGNTATCSQDVVVTDDEDPTITCPATANISMDAGLCTSSASIGTPTTDDNCGVASVVVDNPGPYSVGTTTVTWTVTDDNGNTATCSQDVVVTDDENPTITCPATANISMDAGLCTSSASIGTPTTDDNCGVASVVVDNAGPYSVGTTTVTWTVTDDNGNTATCSQDVVVTDDEDPTILGCPSDIDITPASSNCSPEVTWDIPQADDNCSATLSSTHNSGDSFPVGTTTVTYTATDASGNETTCSFDVTITPSDLVLSIDPSTVICGANISCNGANDGTATANVSGGCLPYNYLWSDGQTTQTATGLGAGTYTVTVTDANGSSESESITLTEPETLEISTYEISEYVGGAGITCNGAADGEIDIVIEGGSTCDPYDISWTSPNGFTSSFQNLTGLEAGSYTVTIEDVNGCSTSATYTISEPASLTPTCSSEDALCNGDANGSVEVSVTGGTEPYSYAWNNGNNNSSQSGLTSGTYSVTVTDANGCISNCNTTVGQPDVLSATVTVVDETLVNGCNGSATANPTGGTPPYSYEWSDGQTTQTASDLCAGTYTVIITDANECEFTTSNIVNPPSCDLDVDVTGTDVSCYDGTDGTVTATPITVQNYTPFTYLWSNGATTQTVSGLSAGPYSVTVTDSIGCEASGTVVITEPTALSISTTVVDELTFGGCDGSATANPSGGTSPYSYDWSDGQTTQTASDLCPGTYTVTITDANGCTETATITVNPLLCTGFSVAINTYGLSCFEAGDGAAVAVITGGTAPFSYSWSNGGTADSISGLAAGQYTLTVTDAVNCSQTVSGNVSQPALLEAVTAVDHVSCYGADNGVVELTVTGGTNPYSFDWSNGATIEDLENVGPGTYNVTVTDAHGCTTTASGTVNEPDTLDASSVDVNPTCFEGTNGSIDLTVTGGLGPYLVSWNSGQNTAEITGLSAGTYTATIVDQNGCIYTYTTTLTEPNLLTPTCTSEDALCNGDANGSVEVSVSGGTEPYSYSWNNGNSTSSQTGLIAGTYSVTITDANGCVASCNSVVGQPGVLTATVDVQDELTVNGCNGSATANPTGGTPPYSYDWSDGQTTQTASNLCAGVYIVTITDANGCEFTTSNVVNPPTCDLDVTLSGTNVSCNEGTDGSATATPITQQNYAPFTYEWNNGDTTQTLTGITAGPYTVMVTDSIGCEASGTVVITEPTPLSVSTSVVDELTFNGCDGEATATSSGGTSPYSYEWSDGQTTSTASNLCPGTYTVTVTDANGCEETVTITVSPLLCTGFDVDINTFGLTCYVSPDLGIGDGAAVAVVTGGTAPYTYLWSTGATTDSIGNLYVGQYTVTVTDAVNCTQTVSGNVTQPALLEAATAVDNVSCHGVDNGVVELTVTGGTLPYSYSWNNGATTEDLNNVGPGTYIVSVTDANGCQTGSFGVVTEPDTLGASSIDVQVSCNEGNNGSIDLEPTGGLPPYVYTWSNGANTQDISGLASGTYTVTFADQNGCLFTYETTISEPDVLVATCSAEDALCNGDANGSVSVSVIGGTEPYSYSWSNGSTDASQSGLTAGTYVLTVTDANGCTATCNATVGQPNILTAVVVVQDETLVNGCNGYATADPTGGTPPYTYEWSNGETTQTITDLCAGTYTVTVTDANECEYTTSNIVNPPSCDLDVDMSSTDVDCNGGETGTATATPITLQNNTPFTYLWNNGATTQTLSGVTAGPYTVVVTDSIGCEASGSVVISEPTSLSVTTSVTDEQSFEGCDGSATATASGGTPPYSYEWSDGQTTSTASDLCPGTYTVTVTDANGCEETVTITVNPLLCTGFSVAINTQSLSCFEAGDGSATAVVTGGTAPFTYLWSNGGTTPTIVGLDAGSYTVTVTDAVNCSQTISANVSQPALLEAATAVDNVSCHGVGNGVVELTVTGGTPDYTFAWDNGATTEDLNNVGPGSYNVLVTDENGCTVNASALVTEPDTLQVSSVDVDPTCFEGNDGSIDLTISGGLGPYLVSWNSGQNMADISGLSAGTYVGTIVDQNGCIYTYSTTLTDPQLVVPTITANGPAIFCEGDSVVLTASEASSYLWSPSGETSQSITVYDAGDYSVSVVTEDGCNGNSASTTVSIYQVDPATITPSGPTEFCDGSSVVLTASQGSSYLWMPNGETTQSITVTESGNYSVTVTDQNGCESSSDNIDIIVFDLPNPTVTANGPLTFCDGGSVTLTSSEAATYFWAPFGQTTQAITITESGIYRVTITNEDGCQSTSDPIQVIVNDNPEPVITAGGPTEFCEGGSVSLNGPAGYTYSWSPNGAATQGLLATQSGDYQLTVTDQNGCTGVSNIITVTEFDVDSATVTVQGPTEFCVGDEVVLTASGGVSYTWSPNGETTQSISVTVSGIYNVTVTDENGCTSTSDDVVITVNPLPDATVTLSGPTEFCEGDSVTISAPAGLTYQWLPNGETSQEITVYGTGTYSVIVTDVNQCSNESVPVTTTMFEQDDVEVVANGPTEFCDGGSVVLTASSGSSFVWYPNGETTPSITVTQSGIYSVSITDANGCSYASGDSVEVVVNPLPVPTITANGPTEFCDEGSVELTSSVADSYFWAPNAETTQSITVTESGVYRVTVTDENGCQGTSAPVNVTVYDLPEPTITASGPLTICPEDSVTLTSSSASSYEWSPNGETTQSITISEPGVYSVMVVDSNGCEGESEAVEVEDLEVEPVTVMADGITEFCDGDSVTLSASSGDAFVWSPNGETTASIVVTESGDYSVFVTDANGCSTDADTVTVTVYDLPEPVITLSGSSSFCEGDSVTLTVTAGEAYLWEPNGETTQSITVYESGSYYAEIADANTCVGMSDTIDVVVFEIEEIEVVASGDTAFCNGGEVVLSASGGQTFEWMPNGEQSESITVTESGEYSVEVLDANGCESFSDTVEIVVFELPQVSLSIDALEMCEGDSTLLTASSDDDVTFEWFENGNNISGAADSTLFVTDSSYYSVLITDVNGCTATDDVPTITVGAVPVAVVTGNTIACPGETLTLTATGGENYLWSNGETTSSITLLSDSIGTYTVTVSNEFCGQTSSDSAVVEVYDAPDALIQTLSNGFLEVDHLFDEVSGDSSIVYWTWDFGDGQFGEGQSTDHTYSTEEFFTIVVTTENENGCLGFDTVEVEITQVIDIPNVFTPNGDGVNDLFFIDNFGVEAYELTVYNRWGIVMHHDDSGEIAWDGRTPAGLEAKSGTYYYELKVSNEFSEGSFTQTGYITLIR